MEYSYQLYSSRNFQPWESIMSMLRDCGYSQVEGIGALYEDLEATQAALTHSGLTMPTGHFSLEMLEQEPERVMTVVKALDMKAVYCPFLLPDQRPDTAAGYIALGQRLQRAGQPLIDAGIRFGWHNHDFEFHPLDDGSYPLDRLFEGSPTLDWEADLAWVVKGGGDPLDWMQRYGDRISAIHVKDIAPNGECADEDGWADVGHGTMEWSTLLQAADNTAAEFFIMEHDNPSDDKRFAARSIDYLKQL